MPPSHSVAAIKGVRAGGPRKKRSGILLDFDDGTRRYSVRLAGMTAWDEHLPSLKVAEQSAEEPRQMGLADVCIIDEETGEVIE
jgi:hypothetical protein